MIRIVGAGVRSSATFRLRLRQVFIARDVMEGWMATLDAQPTLHQKCARLIKYATIDA